MAKQHDGHSERAHLHQLIFDIVEETLEAFDMTLWTFGGSVAPLVDTDSADAGGSELRTNRFVAARVLGDSMDHQHERPGRTVGQPLASRSGGCPFGSRRNRSSSLHS